MERAIKGKRLKRAITGVIGVAILSVGTTGVAKAADTGGNDQGSTTTITVHHGAPTHLAAGIRW